MNKLLVTVVLCIPSFSTHAATIETVISPTSFVSVEKGVRMIVNLPGKPVNWLLVSTLILYRAVEPTRGANPCRVRHAEDATICFGMRR